MMTFLISADINGTLTFVLALSSIAASLGLAAYIIYMKISESKKRSGAQPEKHADPFRESDLSGTAAMPISKTVFDETFNQFRIMSEYFIQLHKDVMTLYPPAFEYNDYEPVSFETYTEIAEFCLMVNNQYYKNKFMFNDETDKLIFKYLELVTGMIQQANIYFEFETTGRTYRQLISDNGYTFEAHESVHARSEEIAALYNVISQSFKKQINSMKVSG